MDKNEQERRARLLKSRAERLPDIRRQFELSQKRNFNANFAPGGQDAKLVGKSSKTTKNGSGGSKKASGGKSGRQESPKTTKNAKKSGRVPQSVKNDQKAEKTLEAQTRKVNLSVSARKGEMVHHQRMLTQDVNAQATQHIIGVPVNKSRYNGYHGDQVTNAQLKKARPDPEAVRIIPIGGVGEFGIGKNMTIIEYKSEMIVIDMGVLFAGNDYPGVNYLIPDIKYLEDNKDKVKAICFTHAHLDHIGACRHLLTKFNPLTPIYGTDFTLGMIKRQMSELSDVPDLNYQVVDPLAQLFK